MEKEESPEESSPSSEDSSSGGVGLLSDLQAASCCRGTGGANGKALLQMVGELSLLVVSGALLSTAAMPTECLAAFRGSLSLVHRNFFAQSYNK